MIANERIIFDLLREKGYSADAACGILGNLHVESGLKPNNVQNSFEKQFGSDAEYTAMVNSGKYSKDQFVKDSVGYGLAQWTYWSRKEGLYIYCMTHSKDISNLNDQINFLHNEVVARGLFDKLNACKSAYDAGVLFMVEFEKPKNQSDAAKKNRGNIAMMFQKDLITSADRDQKIQTRLCELNELVYQTLNGKYGTGEDRRKNLGNKYNVVQTIINYIL